MATLCQPITQAEELAIVKCFWREDVVPTQLKFYSCYLEFYRNQMKGLRFGFLEESFLLTRMAAQTHADLRLIVEKLSWLRNSDFSVSFAAIQDLFPNQSHEAIEISINLALRVWLTLNARGRSESLLTPRNTPVLSWEGDSSTLVNFVNRQFPSAIPPIPPAESWLDSRFSACNLDRHCQVIIEWTNCLADHLHLDPETKHLQVYPFKICLYDHERVLGTSLSGAQALGPIFSKTLLQETVWSLNLLFPPGDKDTDIYLRRRGQSFHNGPPFDKQQRPLDLNDYHHWRGRLLQLRLLHNAETRSLRHALTDRRNTLQLYTLWTAIIIFFLTIIFGVISATTAIIQTKATLRTLDAALEALKLQKQQFELDNEARVVE